MLLVRRMAGWVKLDFLIVSVGLLVALLFAALARGARTYS